MSLVYTTTYRYRRALQTMAAGLFLIYMALVLYQTVYGYGSDGSEQDRAGGGGGGVLDPHASKLGAKLGGPQNAHALPPEDGQLERASMRCIRKKMSLVYTTTYRYRRALQTMAAGLFLIYMALVLYQTVYGYGSDGSEQDRAGGGGGGNLQDFQSLGAMMLGGGRVGAGAGGYEPPGGASAVISKRDNSVVPSGMRDASDNEVDSNSNLVRRNKPGDAGDLGPTADPPKRIPPPPAVTGTPKPPTTELDDLLISVKTTKSYHDTRLEMIIKTWYQLAKEQAAVLHDGSLSRVKWKRPGCTSSTGQYAK
uniref:Fringe-like glycosyltransferase domain-containing protein n=1 Tax=Anopheles atroparvus TaxID=41427 RepID=A0A182JF96_ANOAO